MSLVSIYSELSYMHLSMNAWYTHITARLVHKEQLRARITGISLWQLLAIFLDIFSVTRCKDVNLASAYLQAVTLNKTCKTLTTVIIFELNVVSV